MPFLVDAHRRRVPAQNVERSICIGVDMEAAMPTNKDRLAFAALSVNGSAFRTGLRCVCGIDLAQVSAAFFELVGKDGLEAEPALIEDRAVQCGLLPDHTARFFYGPLGRSRHVFDAQIFQNNRPKAAGKIERGLVRPIAADARSTGRELRGASQRLRSTDGATLASRHNVLCGAMASFDGFERARHGHALPRGDVERVIDVCGKRQRIGNAAIDADARADIDGHNMRDLADEADMPAQRVEGDGGVLQRSMHRPRITKLHQADLGQAHRRPFRVEPLGFDFSPLKAKTVVDALAARRRIVRPAGEEARVCAVEIAQGLLLASLRDGRDPVTARSAVSSRAWAT